MVREIIYVFLIVTILFSCKKNDPNKTVNPIDPTGPFKIEKPPALLSDPLADDSTIFVFAYLIDIYGKKVLSGQQDSVEHIKQVTGKYPAVGSFDLMEYSISRRQHGSNPTGKTESIINWAQQSGGIVSLCWHWNAPSGLINQPGKEWWKGFYTSATTFNLAAALADKNSVQYAELVKDMDTIAYELKKYQTAGIPVLWRPLHEGSGGWFWWGAKGSAPMVELWRIMFDRFTNYHQLHNLIWVYTPGSASASMIWYPGDNYCDVVGLDIYNSDYIGAWSYIQSNFSGRKLVTLSETGSFQSVDEIKSYNTWWVYFSIWNIQDVTDGDIQAVYSNKAILTADELFNR